MGCLPKGDHFGLTVRADAVAGELQGDLGKTNTKYPEHFIEQRAIRLSLTL